MPNLDQKIIENLAAIRERMAQAAISAGRSPDDIQLVAVTKYVGLPETAALLEAGCRDLGESRPQQLWEKADHPELAAAHWHLIGHLQRNKVRRTLPLVELIHSVDSLRLLETVNEAAEQLGQRKRVLLEVNCSGEAEKHGLTTSSLMEMLSELPALRHVEVCGLMTMAARTGGEVVAGKNFSALRQLRDVAQQSAPPEVTLTELSMGMSHDFEVATIVRVGSLLFEGVGLRE